MRMIVHIGSKKVEWLKIATNESGREVIANEEEWKIMKAYSVVSKE
jgi:hypothetical protein